MAAKKTKKKAKKKSTKQQSEQKSRQNKCGKCGDFGHNARSCPGSDGSTTTVIEKDEEEAETIDETSTEETSAPEEFFDLSDVKRASEFDDAPERSAGTPTAVDHNDPLYVPPGKSPSIPKRKRKVSKAQAAFWEKTTKKLAPGAMASAGELTLDIPRISSGNFGIDVALYGGIPQGRFVRITGLPKSAKTGTCLNTVAEYQANHCSECFQRKCDCKDRDVPEVLWIDIEHRLDSMLRWVQSHGVNLDCLRVMGPPTGQNVVDLVDHVIRSAPQAKIGLIVIDSIAHITSQEEINKATLDGPTVGRNAMLMNAGWRKWTSAFHSLGIDNPRKPTVLCINQIRHKVGVNYGSPETQPGGIGQDYASTVDLRFQASLPNFLVWSDKDGKYLPKQKGYNSNFKPKPDQTPDYITVNYRVTASGHCPYGRSGDFNYWLKSAHGRRCGDVDNGLQLWGYAKRYNLIETEGHLKRLFGHEARTFDELEAAFCADPRAQKKAWTKLMGMLSE